MERSAKPTREEDGIDMGKSAKPTREKELRFLHPLIARQNKHSHIPAEDELLAELIKTRKEAGNQYGKR